MEQTRNKNGKFAKQYRFATRNEYEKEVKKLEARLENWSGQLKENEKDIKAQSSLIAKLQKDLKEKNQECKSQLETNHELFDILKFAEKFPIVRLAIWFRYGE